MTEPKTLLQMLNAEPQPAPLSEAAVIIIDAQNEYKTGAVPLVGVDAALDKIEALLDRARAAGAPVVHIRHMGPAGGPYDPAGPMFQIIDQVAPKDGEAIVDKRYPNSFNQTQLDDMLKATGRKSVIIAGFMTHMCVSSTARGAFDLGYAVTVVADAAATRDLPDATGGPALQADQIHRTALTEISDLVGCVTTLDKIK